MNAVADHQGSKTTSLRLAAGAVLVAASFWAPQTVGATVPGANGKIAFESTRDDANGEIYSMNADGSGVTRLTNNSAVDEVPSWSPDGTKIAFDSNRDGDFQIYSMNADGSGVARLTSNAANDFEPAWSPDGSKIAFATDRDGNAEVYVMNADGSGVTRLTNNSAFDGEPAWSPDGLKITFATERDGNREVYVMNADGSAPTNLTSNSALDFSPSWSPDGTRIAFVTNRDGNREVYVMNANGSAPTNLTNNGAKDQLPSWSPDGSKIAFETDRDGNIEVYSMNGDGSAQTNLTGNGASDREPAWQTIASADLAIGLAASPNAVRSGQPLTYTITVHNAGPSNAMGVVVADALPAQSRFVSASPSQGNCLTPPVGSTGTITCSLGFQLTGANATAQIVVKIVVRRTSVSNTVSVSSSTFDPNSANNSATIVTTVK